MALQQETVAVWDDSAAELAKESPDPVWLQDNVSLWLHNMFDHDEVFILDGGDRPVHALTGARRVPEARYWTLARDLAPLIEGVRGRTEELSGRHDRRPGRPLAPGATVLTTGRTPHVSRLVWVDDRPAVASAMIMRESTPGYVRQRGDWSVLISVRYLDGSFLSELTSRHLIEAPRFSRTGERRSGEEVAPLLDDSGNPVGHLVWKPELPGSSILWTLAPLTGGLALFMCAITGALARRLIRTATELAEAEARSSRLAFHDALTGLPNRALLGERLEQALRDAGQGTTAALLLVDLDRFKQVNDTLGHQAGDALLLLFANRLAALAEERDTVARLGGDEFAIVAVGREEAGVEDLCERILLAAAKSFDLDGGAVHVGASIGVATAGHFDAAELTRRADVALYAAKGDGRGVARIFSADLDAAVRERAALEKELRRALVAGELHVWFQPQVCREGRVVGLEALARWQHPTRGLVGPERFIKAAEDTGLIVDLGERVMREAAAMSARWPSLSVAVNVSPAQLRSDTCVKRLIDIVHHAGADPGRIEIEVTEHILLESESVGAGRIQQLRAAGFRLALDDFGTGYSSLSYLQHFRVDKIKIDQSFVSQLATSADSRAIVLAILSLGRALGVQVAAEGVEAAGQFDLLVAGGCDEFQGYLFSEPQPRIEIETLLSVDSVDGPSTLASSGQEHDPKTASLAKP